MALYDQLMGQLLNSDSINNLSKSTNSDSSQMKNLLGMALPLLMQGMQKNASTQSGAESLARALDQHADDPDDVNEVLNNSNAAADGKNILAHILGGNMNQVQSGLAKKSGLSSSQVGSALSMMAPALLSLLGSQKRNNNLNSSGVAGLLSSLAGGNGQNGFGASDLISLVMRDADGDGKSDILTMIKGLFGMNK